MSPSKALHYICIFFWEQVLDAKHVSFNEKSAKNRHTNKGRRQNIRMGGGEKKKGRKEKEHKTKEKRKDERNSTPEAGHFCHLWVQIIMPPS